MFYWRLVCQSACGRGGDIIALERGLMHAGYVAARNEVFRIIRREMDLIGSGGEAKKEPWRRVAT